MLRLAIIGCGWAGERHFLAACEFPEEIEVTVLVDSDEEFLEKRRNEWGVAQGYTDYREALERDDVDAVVIALPHHLHCASVVATAEAGKHILCEKPMAMNVAEADQMNEAAEKHKVTLMVGETIRYQAFTMLIKEHLDKGTLGPLVTARMNFMPGRSHDTYAYPGRRAWLADKRKAGGGIWMTNGIHQVSAARMFFGEVKKIKAVEHHAPGFRSDPQFPERLEGTVSALLTFQSGPSKGRAVRQPTDGLPLYMLVSPEIGHCNRFSEVVIHGAGASLRGDLSERRSIEIYRGKEEREVITAEETGPNAPFVRQMREFIDAIREGRESLASGRSERESLAVVEAGYRSMATGEEVALSESLKHERRGNTEKK